MTSRRRLTAGYHSEKPTCKSGAAAYRQVPAAKRSGLMARGPGEIRNFFAAVQDKAIETHLWASAKLSAARWGHLAPV